MSFHRSIIRGTTALALAGAVAACSGSDNTVLGPTFSGANTILRSYVALGNSITAGYQAGGITDATQRQSYAYLFANQADTRYAYASLADPGCPPPYTNFMTQARPTGDLGPSTSTTCYLRANSPAILNNVAVPGATSVDPTAVSGSPASNALTTFILGGKTQVQRALDADPTFATIWIGNNDVLGSLAGSAAAVAAVTSPATFSTNYQEMIDQLVAGAPHLEGGVLIGVVDVTNVPQVFSAAELQDPTNQALINAAAGTTVAIHPNCLTAPGSRSLININIVRAIRGQQHPPVIACVAGTDVVIPPGITIQIGDALVLDEAEQATISGIVAQYNATISAAADEIGFVYLDPNPLLADLKATGAVPAFPNPTLPNPFGAYFSPDGIHPAAPAHVAVANALIAATNAEYGTSIPVIP